MREAKQQLPVAFAFVNDGKEWHGGLNYFRSLFLALQTLPESTIQPTAFIGAKADIAEYGFPESVKVIRDSAFDRRSHRWILNKLATLLFGIPWVTNRVLLREGLNILSHGSPCSNSGIKTIGWIPDFQHMHLPHFFPAKELKRRTKLYRDLIAKCDLVIVSSESARADFQHFSPHFAGKARVLRFCAVPVISSDEAVVDVRLTYNLSCPFFYIPNQAWAHKNHLTAIRALAELQKHYPDVKVVCSGSLSDYRNPAHLNALRSEIAQRGLTDRFILLGVIPYPHIAPLMRESRAVINPSMFEGWSTTVEEAKALGVPLILSGIDVHREQCERGEAAFFDSLDAIALAALMRDKIESENSERDHLDVRSVAERQHERASEFARTYLRIVTELRDSPHSQ